MSPDIDEVVPFNRRLLLSLRNLGLVLVIVAVAGLVAALILRSFLDPAVAWVAGIGLSVVAIVFLGALQLRLQSSLGRAPKTSEDYLGRGKAFMEFLGDRKRGIDSFSKAIELDPSNMAALFERSSALFSAKLEGSPLGDIQASLDDLAAASRLALGELPSPETDCNYKEMMLFSTMRSKWHWATTKCRVDKSVTKECFALSWKLEFPPDGEDKCAARARFATSIAERAIELKDPELAGKAILAIQYAITEMQAQKERVSREYMSEFSRGSKLEGLKIDMKNAAKTVGELQASVEQLRAGES